MLAAAQWMKGGVALAEFSHEKNTKIKRKKNKEGRGDLYLSGDDYGFYLEAKHERVSLSPDRCWKTIFDDLSQKAMKAAKETRDEDSPALALCFFSF